MSKSITTKSSEETVNLGRELGAKLRGGEVVFLTGDLGGGKTQFSKGIALGIGVTETVVSPTFTVERIYAGANLTLHHFDLYRLSNDREITEEIRELAESKEDIVVIEWPENLEGIQDLSTTRLNFGYIDENQRNIEYEEIR